MYCPAQFREDRTPVLHDLIRQAGLASFVTFGPDGLVATPVPLLLDPDDGPYGALSGHMARANPQWRHLSGETPALAIFMGPDAYVSPSWYPSKQETGRVVPTWNYVAVHAYGPVETFDDPGRLLAQVTALTDRFEAGRPDPWSVGDAPEAFIQAQLKGIVGFRMPITRLEGKRKMSQNRPPADRDGVVEGLRHGNAADQEVAAVVEALNKAR